MCLFFLNACNQSFWLRDNSIFYTLFRKRISFFLQGRKQLKKVYSSVLMKVTDYMLYFLKKNCPSLILDRIANFYNLN